MKKKYEEPIVALHMLSAIDVLTLSGEEKIIPVKADDAVYIPVETKHRIENRSNDPMEFIEIQTGDNLDENDIVRFEDIYGRV